MNNNNNYIIPSIIIGIGFIICTIIISRTIITVKGFNQTITVTGAAYKPIKSNFVIWEGIITVSSPDLESAYAEIKRNLITVKNYLGKQNFKEEEYTVSSIRIQKTFNRERITTGYKLLQIIKLEHTDIDHITRLAKDASSLIEQGIEFESKPPRYLFTKLNEIKIEMIEAATENAKLRAEQLAKSTGRKVGSPRSANVGIFQIRPLHSQQVSDYGISDVTSIEKEIVCTVHIKFSIE